MHAPLLRLGSAIRHQQTAGEMLFVTTTFAVVIAASAACIKAMMTLNERPVQQNNGGVGLILLDCPTQARACPDSITDCGNTILSPPRPPLPTLQSPIPPRPTNSKVT